MELQAPHWVIWGTIHVEGGGIHPRLCSTLYIPWLTRDMKLFYFSFFICHIFCGSFFASSLMFCVSYLSLNTPPTIMLYPLYTMPGSRWDDPNTFRFLFHRFYSKKYCCLLLYDIYVIMLMMLILLLMLMMLMMLMMVVTVA